MLTILVACSETDKTTVSTDSDIEVTFVEEAGAEEAFVANIAIDGMHCEMGCGGRIASELNKLAGVKNTDIDFFGEGETNFA
ncbi:MAG: heavy metal-associated domain-containing protein, partial [Bacteroidota bacterium]